MKKLNIIIYKLKQLLTRPYIHTNSRGRKHYLVYKDVPLRRWKLHRIYYFLVHRWPRINEGMPARRLPEDYRIIENPRNGFCSVIRKSEKEN